MSLPVACVVDASVLIKAFLTEDYSAEVRAYVARALSSPPATIYVPDLAFAECANILWKQTVRSGYPIAQAVRDMRDICALGIPSTPVFDLGERPMELAGQIEKLTAYDACYVALAERLGLPLLTADNKLAAIMAGTKHTVITLDGALSTAP